MYSVAVSKVVVELADGGRLAATLYLPEAGAAPCLLEALPYRKDDVTAGQSEHYERLAREFGYAVCRVDVRGTGSSSGLASDEYPATETDDLCQVVAWLAEQPWCTGAVGMFGTSYSGFNALTTAAARPPALRAICSIYASDDRYTDDVHYGGGLLRWLDLVDYPAYMAAMCALPPVPAEFGPGWREEWLRRLDEVEPWLLRWIEEQHDGDFWRTGSLRGGSPRADSPRAGLPPLEVPTMFVAGWGDGYGNILPRVAEDLRSRGVPHRVVAGPWAHAAPEHSLPGPGIDLMSEMVRWWDHWLRGGAEAGAELPESLVHVRSSTPPGGTRVRVNGGFRVTDGWPVLPEAGRPLGTGRVPLPTDPDIGVSVWNNCAGSLPWGQALDQRSDDARSVVVDWPSAGETIVGRPRLRARVRSSEPVATLAVRLCDVAPDGASELISRGVLNLTHRHGSRSPEPLTPGQDTEVVVELDNVAHQVVPGHTLRLALATSEWPNVIASPVAAEVVVDLAHSELLLPLATGELGRPSAIATTPDPVPDTEGVVWTIEQDVSAGAVRCRTGYGSAAELPGGGSYRDSYVGLVEIDVRSRRQLVTAESEFEIGWPGGPTVRVVAGLAVTADAEAFDVTLDLTADEDGTPLRARNFERRISRDLQ